MRVKIVKSLERHDGDVSRNGRGQGEGQEQGRSGT